MFAPPSIGLFAFCRSAGLSGGVAGLLVAVVASPAAAEIAWHADLEAARTAAASTGRPVLALVVPSWNESKTGEVFSSPEVEALISACFEPVRLLGIERVPSVVVLDAGHEILSRFECPATSAEFVAAAARAAQLAATTAARQDPPPTASSDPESSGLPVLDDGEQPTASMTAKVRQLSSFATGRHHPSLDPAQDDVPEPAADQDLPSASQACADPAGDPALPTSPPAWPAEQTVASAFDPIEPAQAPAAVIEPATTSTSPWLVGASQPQPAGDEKPAATASDLDKEPASEATNRPNWFLSSLQRPLDWLTGRSSKPTVEPPPQMPAARPQTPAAVVASAAAVPPTEADPHGSMPLGLEGFCPVSIADRGIWVEGRAQWGVRHRGRTYLFAGPEQQRAFLTTPDRYAPALSGDDPVLAFDSGTSEPGRRAFGVTYQSRMYLFSSPETRAAFAADPARYTARVQLAEGLTAPEAPRRF